MKIAPDWLTLVRRPKKSDAAARAAAPESTRQAHAGDAADGVRRQLQTAIDRQGDNPDPVTRLRLLELSLEQARNLLPAIESEVETTPLPLDARPLQLALAGDNLLKALAAGYVALLSDGPSAEPQVPIDRLSVARGMECLTWRLKLAARAYTPPSTNTWQSLHRLFAEANRRGLRSATAGGRSAESEYLLALLTAWANPGRYPRQEIALLVRTLERQTPYAVITTIANAGPARDNSPIYIVGANDTGPGRRLATVRDLDPSSPSWLVDCRGIVRSIERSIARQELAMTPTEEAATSPLPILLSILASLRAQPTRRFARQSFKPRGDLVCGLPELLGALAGGRITDQEAHSEWAIVDESPDGFGLRYLRGRTENLQVGELVGLRPRERERRLHVCLVRRITSGGASRLDLGLQELSPEAHPLALAAGDSPADEAIFFPSLPAWDGVAGLIATNGRLAQGALVRVGNADRPVVHLLESRLHYQLWAIGN
jgi:cyclic-di-GMP-binding protein